MTTNSLASARDADLSCSFNPVPSRVANPDVRALFHVTAVTDPGFLPRMLEPFAKMGLTPSRLHASREDGDGAEMTVDLRLAAVPQRDARLIEGMVRAIVGVRQVIVVLETAD